MTARTLLVQCPACGIYVAAGGACPVCRQQGRETHVPIPEPTAPTEPCELCGKLECKGSDRNGDCYT